MTLDTDLSVPQPWRDDDFTNGQQYKIMKRFTTEGIHRYRIWCSDGIDWNETIITTEPVIPGPPLLKPIPDQYIEEDEELNLDLAEYISDPDTPEVELTININSSYGQVNGTVISFVYPNSFNYPSGRKSELVNISVTDGEFSSYRDLTIWVSPVNDPPMILPIPTQIVIENRKLPLNLSEYIFDIDNPFKELEITEDSLNASIDDYTIFFNYSTGGETDLIRINVSDGDLLAESTIRVKVVSSKVSFVLRDISDINAIEDVKYELNLTQYIIIIKGSTENLRLTCTSQYSTVFGLSVIFLYPDTFTYTLNKKFEDVTIKVIDDVVDYTQTVTMKVNVTSVNDAPKLYNGTVNPKYGNISIQYVFKVYYFDVDGSNNIDVEVIIDGKSHEMNKLVGDKSKYPGIEYSISKSMEIGNHYYYFTCNDGTSAPNRRSSTHQNQFFVTGNLGAQITPEQDYNKKGNETFDLDTDGIPDTWELFHGLDNLNHSDASADFDGDNFNNLLEYLGDDGLPGGNDSTDPNNHQDKPSYKSISPESTTNYFEDWQIFLAIFIIIVVIMVTIYYILISRGLGRTARIPKMSMVPDVNPSRPYSGRNIDLDGPDQKYDEETGRVELSDMDDLAVDAEIDDFDTSSPADEVPVTEVDLTMDDQPFLESDAEETESEIDLEETKSTDKKDKKRK